jgi:hypothetical protein
MEKNGESWGENRKHREKQLQQEAAMKKLQTFEIDKATQ